MAIYTIALVAHIIICVALVLVVLAQTSKGGLDASLGGAAMNVFGGSGASKFLRKWTQILGVVFAISCVFMAIQVKTLNVSKTPKALEGNLGQNKAAKANSGTNTPAQAPNGK